MTWRAKPLRGCTKMSARQRRTTARALTHSGTRHSHTRQSFVPPCAMPATPRASLAFGERPPYQIRYRVHFLTLFGGPRFRFTTRCKATPWTVVASSHRSAGAVCARECRSSSTTRTTRWGRMASRPSRTWPPTSAAQPSRLWATTRSPLTASWCSSTRRTWTA